MEKLVAKIPKGLIIVIFTYLVCIIAILPLRNLGYDDDFAYHHTVNNFLNTGVLKISQWSGPSAIFTTYWGALFSKIFGFSYKTLHFSVISLFFMAVLCFYFLLREFEIDDMKAMFFTIVLFTIAPIFRYTFTF